MARNSKVSAPLGVDATALMVGQPSTATKPVRKTGRTKVPAVVPPETVIAPEADAPQAALSNGGPQFKHLQEIVAYDLIIKNVGALRKEVLAKVMPAMFDLFIDQGGGLKSVDTLNKTVEQVEDGATASVQLKVSSGAVLKPDDVLTMTAARVPLRRQGGETVINSKYGVPGEVTTLVLDNLRRLIVANPDCGVPSDLITTLPVVHLPATDALLRVLNGPKGAAQRKALSVLANVAVIKGTITEQAQAKVVARLKTEMMKGAVT